MSATLRVNCQSGSIAEHVTMLDHYNYSTDKEVAPSGGTGRNKQMHLICHPAVTSFCRPAVYTHIYNWPAGPVCKPAVFLQDRTEPYKPIN